MSESPRNDSPNRRTFLKGTAAAAVAGTTLSLARSAHAAVDDTIKIGLIGCGGRGTGAAVNALKSDKNIRLVAMADAFEDQLKKSHNGLNARMGNKVDVPLDRQFVGFDAYQKLVDLKDIDVVLLTTPPHFRPMQYKAAVEAGKHIFCEKPVAVDAPGVRSVIETTKKAKEKNLAVVSGLCYRYHLPKREVIKRIHGGEIGEIRAIHTNYNTGTLWHRGRRKDWSDTEWQMRNWLYFTWLSGDHIVEQHIHSLDKTSWILGDKTPLRAVGMGGRQVRTEEKWGNIYDHHAVVYEFEGGVKVFANTRQMSGTKSNVSDHVYGSKGYAEMQSHRVEVGDSKWKYRGPSPSMYDQEHAELYASIRAGEPINNGDYMANSTMMAIMGRMATYTGQAITWDMAMNSKEDLSPAKYAWGPMGVRPVAMPGQTKFV
ncbi:MAG: Gfo/Idh/MocA family oxidoreductase [Planctomycetes bacterium]|nr:Gfo/Idh/MocA family oxidoreductase [Planctomycetota bacterium]